LLIDMPTSSPLQLSVFLILGITAIILLTSRLRLHAFFALVIGCLIVGLGAGLSLSELIAVMKEGFGNIMRSLGLVIVLGTALGLLVEYTGSTRTMADFVLRRSGTGRAPLAMNITGFIVGLPIFCDSGYIVLSGLTRSISRQRHIPMTVISVAMATGLYSVHCLVPPHPGAAAAAGTLGVDLGRLILAGIVTAIPASMAGYFWSVYAGKKEPAIAEEEKEIVADERQNQTSVILAFLPIVLPIVLIALKSFLSIDPFAPGWLSLFNTVGDPVVALSIGILLALLGKRSWTKTETSSLFRESAEKAGGILVIIGAGGAFGAVLAATGMGDHFTRAVPLGGMGIFFPFLLTFILKTAQGSSTVAIITAASIVQPLLPALGLSDDKGRLLCMLAMGSGSMMISHANDAYFWVIAKFSDIEMKPMLKVYSVATILMGLSSLAMVYLLSVLL
jgi:GntP family gluconate:H+ symporter